MELQSSPAAVTAPQHFSMLKRSFDFKSSPSVRPDPAVMGRLLSACSSLPCILPVSKQDFHSRVEIENVTFCYNGSIVHGTEWYLSCLCQDIIPNKSSDFASFLPFLHYFLYVALFGFFFCLRVVVLFFPLKPAITSYWSFWEDFKKDFNITGHFSTVKKPVFKQDSVQPHSNACSWGRCKAKLLTSDKEESDLFSGSKCKI